MSTAEIIIMTNDGNSSHAAAAFTPYPVVVTIGVAYIATALIVIPLHIICSILMWRDKEMRNPTYQFIINLSVADVIALLALGLYAGIIILGAETTQFVDRFMGFWCLTAWYVNCVMFAFIAFSRWISMTRTHLVTYIFKKRNLLAFHAIPWILIAVFYLYSLVLYPNQTFYFYPQFFTWGFKLEEPFGEYLHWHNFVFNTLCALVEMLFNVLSLKWVHDTRKTIQTIATAENRRRETKLLIQCFILGCVFTLASVMFTIVFAAGLNSPMAYLGMQIVWTFNHCVNPLVYLSVNTKLRGALLRMVTCNRFVRSANGSKGSKASKIHGGFTTAVPNLTTIAHVNNYM